MAGKSRETLDSVKKTVVEILSSGDIDQMTEYKVRCEASEKLGMDLNSDKDLKKFVRKVVEDFLSAKGKKENDEVEDEEEEEVKAEKKKSRRKDEGAEAEEEEEEEEEEEGEDDVDENGDPILCRLSKRRRVTLQEFRGKTLVSIREYYEKDGRELPSSKGISLTTEQWAAFKKAVPSIQAAIEKMQSEEED